MAESRTNNVNKTGAVDRIVMIPAIRRYEIDCWGNAIKQIEDGSWVRYDDHVTAVNVMLSEIEKLNLAIEEL